MIAALLVLSSLDVSVPLSVPPVPECPVSTGLVAAVEASVVVVGEGLILATNVVVHCVELML
jgi:hypothetical protein